MEVQLVVVVCKIFFSLALLFIFTLFLHLYNAICLKPQTLRSKLRKQGINGPQPSFLHGNLPDMKKMLSMVAKAPPPNIKSTNDATSIVFPYLVKWMKEYGNVFTFSLGNVQVLHVTHPEMVKEMSLCTDWDLGKPSYQKREFGPFLGNGILTSNGPTWAYHRKVIAPELYMERIKGMVNLMVEAADILTKSWEIKIGSEGGVADVRADLDLQNVSSFVIAKSLFGKSYGKGTEIFLKVKAIKSALSRPSILNGIPGLRYLPTKNNRKIWRLEKEASSMILRIAKERKDDTSEKDLFQSIIQGAKNGNLGLEEANQFIVDNCKNIFDAGFESTSITGSWALMLLASHPEWQERARAEVLQVLRGSVPDADTLRKMKTLTMVIQETLRLYPPVTFITREAFKDMKLAHVSIPKGINIWLSVLPLHYDPNIWGNDAHEFNPERFADGVKGACKQFPLAYMPFGVGPRVCAGQHFATVELKILLALILSKFSFTLSPQYRHSPSIRMLLAPKDGVSLAVKRL